MQEEGDDTSVKLSDFAFAKRVTKSRPLMTLCGTAQYVAPEILKQSDQGYDHRCDIWSLGVFTYVLLGGYPPFEGVKTDLATEISRGEFEFHEEYWSDISESAKKMISSLLVVEPQKRVSAGMALSCEWMAAEEEQLVLRDLSIAQSSMKNKMQPKTKVKMAVQTVRFSLVLLTYKRVLANNVIFDRSLLGISLCRSLVWSRMKQAELQE